MKKQYPAVVFLRKHRLATLVIATAVVLVAVGLYTIWSVNTWSAYETKYISWQKDLQKNVDTALKMPTSNPKERGKKVAALHDINKNIVDSKDTLCMVNGTIAWQGFISSLKTRQKACGGVANKATAFEVKLSRALAYLVDERSLAKITDDIAADQKEKMAEGKFEAQVARWDNRIKTIKKLNVQGPFEAVKNSAAEKSQATKSAWKAVYDAHKAKNKSKYLEAQTALTKAYEAFSSLSKQTDKEFTELTVSLKTAYLDLF